MPKQYRDIEALIEEGLAELRHPSKPTVADVAGLVGVPYQRLLARWNGQQAESLIIYVFSQLCNKSIVPSTRGMSLRTGSPNSVAMKMRMNKCLFHIFGTPFNPERQVYRMQHTSFTFSGQLLSILTPGFLFTFFKNAGLSGSYLRTLY